jgi:hypothetical protein
MESAPRKSWWYTLPGVLTALAGIITAVGGLVTVLYQVGVFGHVPKVPEPPTSTEVVDSPVASDSRQCPEQDAKICREVGASCFLSINDGSHPHSDKPAPRGYRAGDYVSLCWWKEKNQSSCPNTGRGGFWSTPESFWRKFGWAPPPDGWNQCMSQCANIGGGWSEASKGRCNYP